MRIKNTSADLIDIGIYGNYNDGLSDGGASEYTGLFRDASDSTWTLFDGLEVEPGTTVNTSGTGYALADFKAGDIAVVYLNDITLRLGIVSYENNQPILLTPDITNFENLRAVTND